MKDEKARRQIARFQRVLRKSTPKDWEKTLEWDKARTSRLAERFIEAGKKQAPSYKYFAFQIASYMADKHISIMATGKYFDRNYRTIRKWLGQDPYAIVDVGRSIA